MKLSIRKLLKKKLKSKIDAFTLVEMLIVLALLGMSLLITIKPAANMVQRYQEKIFWQNLQHAWNKELSTLAQRKENGKVLFNDQKIIFYENNQEKTIIDIPSTLELYRGYRLHINQTGQMNGGTIVFNSKDHQRQYYLVIQLGWGKYYVKQTK